MTLTLSFEQILAIVGMLLAGGFGILKLAGSHFIKNIASKFSEIEADMKKQAVDLNLALDNKLNGMALTTKDKIEHESVKIRLANEERHSAYLEKFSTKDELLSMSAKHDKHMDDIFKLLRSIDNKVANSVTREEFNAIKDRS